MQLEFKTAIEISKLIKEQATISLGPWPRDLQLFIFTTGTEWRCGLSPALQTSDGAYRDGVLQIAREFQKSIRVAQS